MTNLSSSSQEENISIWKNKLESACQTNSNSFWNLSELSFYKSSLMKDFKKFKKKIKNSLETFKSNVDTKDFLEESKEKQKEWLLSLENQMQENHERILESFHTFEKKLESGAPSEAENTQMKGVGMDLQERGSHMTGFHFIEMINNQTAGRRITGSEE